MAFLVQNSSGTVNNANAYISTDFFKAYHIDRFVDLCLHSEAAIQGAIVQATDYVDTRFRWIGEKQNVDQRTGWPRIDAEDLDDKVRSGIPFEVEEACAEYALIALTQTLNPSPTVDATGRVVISKSSKVGPIEKSTQYATGGPLQLPEHPIADNKLAAIGLIVLGISLRRA